MSRAPLRVAVLGAGTVGLEVVRGLLERSDRLCATDGAPLILAGVACRNVDRAREAGIPADLLTDAPAHLVAAPDTDVVVELMGGDEPARTLIAAALGAGKPVVTANKHVVAHHGPDLEAIARRAGVAFRFEAAVGGGIPILGPLGADLAANDVTRVRGIVNGTTNYILSAMARDGLSYSSVLADAQARGYAEADPAGDVEGDDAVNKLVILARLAFGQWLEPGSVARRPPTVRGWGEPGIVGVDADAIAGAAHHGLAIKLLATAAPAPGAISAPAPAPAQGGVAAAVVASAVPADGSFGRTEGVTNRIQIDAIPLGTLDLSGPGAGGAATSSAVLGDLVAIARGGSSTWAGLPPASESTTRATGPFEDVRRWLAVISQADQAHEANFDRPGPLNAAVLPAGVAIRTAEMDLEAARSLLRPNLRDGADATLYPVED
jgi:homoserine dehydrogenase